MSSRRRFARWCLGVLIIASAAVASSAAAAEGWRFDCGTAGSELMPGYEGLTGEDVYDGAKGYGWEGVPPKGVVFGKAKEGRKGVRTWEQPFIDENSTALTRDGVVGGEDLVFRADVPDGTYRVTVVIGDLSEKIGSIDVRINGKVVGEHVAAWAVGGYRLILASGCPMGWWRYVGDTVEVKDGIVRIGLSKNESYYEEQLEEQKTWKNPYTQWHHAKPVVSEPPYNFIGWPFVHNSVMGIEIVPHVPAPVTAEGDRLRLTRRIQSPALEEAILKFNEGDFAGAAKALDGVKEKEARVAKAAAQVWLAGRLEIEMERTLIAEPLEVLRGYAAGHPEENEVREMVRDGEMFQKALATHLNRGELGTNHGIENDKAVSLWWTIPEGSPLYYKAQLCSARAAHMLLPYIPTLGVERQILEELEKKFPENRHVKYLLHWEWEPYGDGSDSEDWYMVDYASRVKDSPEWVRELYPALANLVDWSEWWIKFKQYPEGNIGGGWGDDVEIVAAFGYFGFTSKGVSEISVQGTARLVEGMWNLSEVDSEIGYCLPLADAEHTAEWTGNTLGVMVQIDYGNPSWIERSTKTAKLMRDLWTGYNAKGQRHFRSNFFGAAQVGSMDRMNDAWINYRAVRPAVAVLQYNRNRGLSKLFVELADGWLAAAMSTDRGKPRGVLPGQVSFPEGLIGGTNSPNWYTASHPPGTVNYDWTGVKGQIYKEYVQDLLLTVFEQTQDAKYLEPLRLEYELAAKYGRTPEVGTGARLQKVGVGKKTSAGETGEEEEKPPAKAGSERWVGENLDRLEKWLIAERMMKGRSGELENDVTKEEIVKYSSYVNKILRTRFPLMTTEASATDRVAFHGIVNPFFIYTGGAFGGPFLTAAITYENTTKDFAAAVMGADAQGFRILYHSLAAETREVGIVPWYLEPGGKYVLKYGPDADEDEVMDAVVEEREFHFPQAGTPIRVKVDPRVTYVVEVDQVERGRGATLAPDPGLSASDIRYETLRMGGIILAKIHNVGAKAVKNVEVAFYDGDPEAGGKLLGSSLIPNIEAPNELEPRAVTVGINWAPTRETHEIYVVVDPSDEIKDEITTFNNVAHTTLPKEKKAEPVKKQLPQAGFRGGRR